MANNGILTLLNPNWISIQVVEFGPFYRMIFDGAKIDVTLTVRKDDPSSVEANLIFIPTSYNSMDYFLKVDSNVKNA